MQLAKLFRSLSYGELSNLAMSEAVPGEIQAKSRPKIVEHANAGLLKLYSRFVLKESDLLVQTHEHITQYHLLPRFAVNYTPKSEAEDEPIRYILDLPAEPFLGDLLKVLEVFDMTACKLPLNDEAQPYSVFTPQVNVLQVPRSRETGIISVLYQARHPELQGELDEEITLPDVLHDAFRSFIAYKVFSHMNTQESTAKAQEFLGFYENECRSVTEKDLVNSSISTSNRKFHARGWI